MNIFKNRDKALSDDLPGRMPRTDYGKLEAEMGQAVQASYARKEIPRTPAQLAEELTSHAIEFERGVAIAEDSAKAYCATYEELTRLVDTKLESIEAQRKELQKIRATLPRIGEKDEETSSNVDLELRVQSERDHERSQNAVQLKPIQGLNKPLPSDRR